MGAFAAHRGYGVFAAWLNHVDAKAINSLVSLFGTRFTEADLDRKIFIDNVLGLTHASIDPGVKALTTTVEVAAEVAPRWLVGADAHLQWRRLLEKAVEAGELALLHFGSKLPIEAPTEPQTAPEVKEKPQDRRARWLVMFEAEEKRGKRGALTRLAKSEGVDRSNMGKDIDKARAERDTQRRAGGWTAQLVQDGKRNG